jgi:hypothetical protein
MDGAFSEMDVELLKSGEESSSFTGGGARAPARRPAAAAREGGSSKSSLNKSGSSECSEELSVGRAARCAPGAGAGGGAAARAGCGAAGRRPALPALDSDSTEPSPKESDMLEA